MKVGQISGVGSVYNNQGVRKVDKANEIKAKKDVVSISGQGQDYAVAQKAVAGVPDTRQDLVSEFTNKVDSGNYNVSEDKIAEKIVKNLIGESV